MIDTAEKNTQADVADLLPEELQAQLKQMEEQRQQMLATLTNALIQKRRKAVDYRQQSGIEAEWAELEEAYEGIDDANRATEKIATTRLQKPRSDGGAIYPATKNTNSRSTVFLNITRHYVDAAAARIADILLPSDDRNYSLRPTPIQQDIIESQVTPEMLQSFGVQSVQELMDLKQEDAKQRVEKAQTRIDDWLVECQYHGEVRKVIEDASKLGTGILRGPTPARRKTQKVFATQDSITMASTVETVPESRRIDPWDFFPEDSCGESIHNGSHCWERARLSAKQLRDMIGAPGVDKDAIIKCLEEGPGKLNLIQDGRDTKEDDRFEAWYYYGQVTGKDLSVATKSDSEAELEFVDVVGVIINDRLVKMARSALDNGELPFDVFYWQRRVNLPWGIGVAKQINVPQRMLNAATRKLNDNSGLSNAPQIVIKKGVVAPADGNTDLYGGKVWLADSDTFSGDLLDAFRTFDIPTRQPELMNIINFALKMAEDVTGLPMLMQGQQGNAPDTVGGMTILNQNGNVILKRQARNFDDNITEPHMRRYYAWVMTYGDESEKGDFQVDARGSSALVDRAIQQQAIMQIGQLVANPVFGADPKRWMEEVLKANKINPKDIMLSDKEQVAQQQTQLQAQQQQIALAAQQKEMDRQHKEKMHLDTIQKDLAIAHDQHVVDMADVAERAKSNGERNAHALIQKVSNAG